ncbi:MAG TPA: isochorismatase family protein [Nitrososphaeraceae archaeon]
MANQKKTINRIHGLLTPDNCALMMIDFQPQMAFAVESIDGQTLVNNATGLAKAAKIFNVPTILTTVGEKSFSGPTFAQIRKMFPEHRIIDRTNMNPLEDEKVVNAFKKTGRKKLVLAGLWTEVCIVCPAIQALQDGYEVYIITDACGGVSDTAHDMAAISVRVTTRLNTKRDL